MRLTRFTSIIILLVFLSANSHTTQGQENLFSLQTTLEMESVSFVDWSEDGEKFFALTNSGSSVTFWDTDNFEAEREICDTVGRLEVIDWSPDDKYVVCVTSAGLMWIWEVATNERKTDSIDLYEIEIPQEFTGRTITAAKWQPDGDFIALGMNGGVVLWNVNSDELTEIFSDNLAPGIPIDVEWLDSDILLASNLYGDTLIITASGEITRIMESLEFSSLYWGTAKNTNLLGPNLLTVNIQEQRFAVIGPLLDQETGSFVAWAIFIREIETGVVTSSILAHEDPIYAIAWSPDGSMIATAGDDRIIKIWDPDTGKLLDELDGHEDTITSLSWNPDNSLLASGSLDNSIKIWAILGE